MIRHAGLLAARLDGRWRGVLIEGPSGAGKSDLGLRAMVHGLRLVSDDRTTVFVSGGRLFGRAPPPLAGLLEVRGVGVPRLVALPAARIVMLARCVVAPEMVDRQPAAATEGILGVPIPILCLWPFESSATMKLIMALQHLGARP